MRTLRRSILTATLLFSFIVPCAALVAGQGTPDAATTTEVVLGSGVTSITFANGSLSRTMSAMQLRMLAARVGVQEGDFFFIVSDMAPDKVFSCGACASPRASISINLPPNSTLLRVSSARNQDRSSLLITGVTNDTPRWNSYSSMPDGTYQKHQGPSEIASSK